MATEYRNILHNLKGNFEKGVVTEAEYHGMCDTMQNYLEKFPHIAARMVWQTQVNAETGYPLDYDFDYGGKGPSHIRWAFTFCNSDQQSDDRKDNHIQDK